MSGASFASARDVKEWSKLRLAKHRRASGLFLAEGLKVAQELLASDAKPAAVLFTEEAWARHGAQIEKRLKVSTPHYLLNAKQFAKISQDVSSEGIIAVVHETAKQARDLSPAALGDRVLLLHHIGDPGNLGAIARSALWFGFETIIVGSGSVDVGNHKVIKSSMGAVCHLRIYEGADFAHLIGALCSSYIIIAATLNGEERPRVLKGKIALLLGGESHGLPKGIADLAHHRWRIDGTGKIDSLSLPQAAAIMMYACSKGKA